MTTTNITNFRKNAFNAGEEPSAGMSRRHGRSASNEKFILHSRTQTRQHAAGRGRTDIQANG